MSKFQDYQRLKAEFEKAQEWAEMIGKMPTRCTVNALGKLHVVTVAPTICYQAVNGGPNYHDAPKLLQQALQENWMKQARSNIRDALLLMKANVNAARKEAVDEYAALLDADKADNTALVVVPQRWDDGCDPTASAFSGM